MLFRSSLSRRDAFLLLTGACLMQVWTLFMRGPSSLTFSDYPMSGADTTNPYGKAFTRVITQTTTVTTPPVQTHSSPDVSSWDSSWGQTHSSFSASSNENAIPRTTVLSHAPGWTLFRNLYMSNGTLFIVTHSTPFIPPNSNTNGGGPAYGNTRAKGFPELRNMISTGLMAQGTKENIARREPKKETMTFISVEDARKRWGGKNNRVWEVQGNTLLVNEPGQFLRHYYHFVAELFFGVQAFWHSYFSSSSQFTAPAPIHRLIFANANANDWRDNPGFNSYFLRAAFPSLSVEHSEDWHDRIDATLLDPVIEGDVKDIPASQHQEDRVWRFPLILLSDRSAANKGQMCRKTHRMASEAWAEMVRKEKQGGAELAAWWNPVREAMWKFAGVEHSNDKETLDGGNVGEGLGIGKQVKPKVQGNAGIGVEGATKKDKKPEVEVIGDVESYQIALPMPKRIVITYISRQATKRRKLVDEDHEGLVTSLKELVKRKNDERAELLKKAGSVDEVMSLEWDFQLLEAEHLSRDDQVKAAARTTILLGVHGNGLTHLVWMKPNRVSSVIEIFCPDGFAHDYWWTAGAVGIRHWAVWNDTTHTYPDKPKVNYPSCFQGNSIPVHGPAVAQLIEDRVNGKL